MILSLVLAGCRQEEPVQEFSMPVTVNLIANDVMAARNAVPVRRAIGDPGTAEQFLFPHHLYVIVMRQKPDKSWELWQYIERTLTDGDWTPGRYAGLLSTAGDSIYQYKDKLTLLLSNGSPVERQQFVGKVFAIASAVSLTFDKALNTDGIQNLNDALTLKFNASNEVQGYLQHIYSTPYNYEKDGMYYGEFSSVNQRVPTLNLLLYHIAAKVDIKWSVDEGKRINKTDPSEAIRLTNMKAKNLFNGYAYCFKPMENTAAAKLTAGYEREIVTPENEGLWWEGRAYFYTIPYTVTDDPGYFPLQMEMSTNGSSDKYRPTLNMQVNTSSPFVPWMRAMFNISNKLTDTEETKTIDL